MDKNSGQVEGECANDLARYLINSLGNTDHTLTSVVQSRAQDVGVIELGCGCGLPLITLVQELAKFGYGGRVRAVFQDNSEETLREKTRVFVDSQLGDLPGSFLQNLSIEYTAYSWGSSRQDDLKSAKSHFDIVLSSECIYRPDLFPVFWDEISRLQPPIVLIAAKRYYFGCGGGTIEFEAWLAQNQTSYNLCVDWVGEDGSSNTREILLLTRK